MNKGDYIMDIRYNNHPEDSKHYDTEKLRNRYLIETIFKKDQLLMTYSHHDRLMILGAMPVFEVIQLPVTRDLGTDYFLERREIGIINVGGKGYITYDGQKTVMNTSDGLYLGCQTKEVVFESSDPNEPAKFYMTSAPSLNPYPAKYIPFREANPVKWGSPITLNERTIYQYVHPAGCESTQLVMGMTILNQGSSWNTMPCHTHERRMEVYFYFNMKEDTRVFHFMGKPDETRHIIIKNEQAVISPSWSIHSGVGTSNYTFIWAMCGENKTFDDMDFVNMKDLK
jgi:4-deoxy-L-threo-5-hexosulose-uronate ketol-isomerase